MAKVSQRSPEWAGSARRRSPYTRRMKWRSTSPTASCQPPASPGTAPRLRWLRRHRHQPAGPRRTRRPADPAPGTTAGRSDRHAPPDLRPPRCTRRRMCRPGTPMRRVAVGAPDRRIAVGVPPLLASRTPGRALGGQPTAAGRTPARRLRRTGEPAVVGRATGRERRSGRLRGGIAASPAGAIRAFGAQSNNCPGPAGGGQLADRAGTRAVRAAQPRQSIRAGARDGDVSPSLAGSLSRPS